jgi:hypothetical protein
MLTEVANSIYLMNVSAPGYLGVCASCIGIYTQKFEKAFMIFSGGEF